MELFRCKFVKRQDYFKRINLVDERFTLKLLLLYVYWPNQEKKRYVFKPKSL